MQAREFLTCRPLKSRKPLPLFSFSASSPAPTLPRDSAKYSSSSFSLDRFQPLRGNTSPPAGEARLPPPADDCVVSGLDDPNTVVRCELFQGSESLCSLPACATVRAVLSAGPSGASDWVGFQDLYDTARGIIDLCKDGQLQSGLPSRPYRYSESGYLLCSGGNPAYGSLLHPIQGPVIAGCLESLRLQSQRAVHDSVYECWRYCVIQLLPLHNQLDGYSHDLMIEFVGDWCCAKTLHVGR